MNKMSDIELLLILGFYYIGKEKNVERFTTLFNAYFGKNLSIQMILHEVSRFRNANPANNVGGSLSASRYQKIWSEYITNDRVPELKELYKSFLSQRFLELIDTRFKKVQEVVKNDNGYEIHDEPKALDMVVGNKTEGFKRDCSVVDRALFAAGYLCEGECECELFVRQDGKTYYTEGHHLIPLSFQSLFGYSLDVEANVVSLCPRCHRLLHYGHDKEQLLKILYQKRIARLRMCRIAISYEKLLLLYAGMRACKKDE